MSQTQSLTDCTLLDTVTWFQKARPECTTKDFSSQLGVHYEEVAESLDALKAVDHVTNNLILDAANALEALANHLKASDGVVEVDSPIDFLDALCDQIVTATGVAHTLDYDILGAMDEVNRSNFSKFDAEGNPIYNENKKVMKGDNYFKANLVPFLPGTLQGS